MLNISHIPPLGSGEDRVVYPHPTDSTRCIKIPQRPVHDLEVTGVRDTLFYLSRGCRKESLDYNSVDVAYATKLHKQNDEQLFRHIPRCYGFVDTDLGPGVVWQYICDFDGRACATLKDFKHRGTPLTASEVAMLWRALQEFFTWQLKHGILLREMAYTNILVCRLAPERVRLYHIDAIGCADLIPLARHAVWFAKLRVMSKVSRFRKRMVQWLGPPPSSLPDQP